MSKIRVALVNSQPMLLDAMAGTFSTNDFMIVAKTVASREAVEIARSRKPDVIILDPGDPMCAPHSISAITRLANGPKVVVFTTIAAIEQAVRALEGGATGYLTTTSHASELREAVQAVHVGDTFISPSVATKLVASLRTTALRRATTQKRKLTVREEQIVDLLHEGKTNKEIANVLALSEKTVKHYMTVLMHKLEARSRLEVILAFKDSTPAAAASSLRL